MDQCVGVYVSLSLSVYIYILGRLKQASLMQLLTSVTHANIIFPPFFGSIKTQLLRPLQLANNPGADPDKLRGNPRSTSYSNKPDGKLNIPLLGLTLYSLW